MTSPNHLTVKFEYSAADHSHAFAEERHSMFFGWWWRPVNIVVMAIIYGRQAVRSPDSSGNLVLFAVLLPFAAWMIFMPEFVRSRDRARFRREAARRDDLVETRTFGPDGFRPGTHWPQPIPWSLVTKVAETKRYFFIYHSTSHCAGVRPESGNVPRGNRASRECSCKTSCDPGMQNSACSLGLRTPHSNRFVTMKFILLAALTALFTTTPAKAQQSAGTLDVAAAGRFAALALACVQKEYPNKIAHVLNSPADVKSPRELTPAFYGCYDWHSSVHGHWLLARLVREFPKAPFAANAHRRAQGEPHAGEHRRRGGLPERHGARVVRAALRPGVAAAAGRRAARNADA